MSGVIRTAAARLTEEPGAEKPHAGICAGASGNWRPYRDGAAPGEETPEDPWAEPRGCTTPFAKGSRYPAPAPWRDVREGAAGVSALWRGVAIPSVPPRTHVWGMSPDNLARPASLWLPTACRPRPRVAGRTAGVVCTSQWGQGPPWAECAGRPSTRRRGRGAIRVHGPPRRAPASSRGATAAGAVWWAGFGGASAGCGAAHVNQRN